MKQTLTLPQVAEVARILRSKFNEPEFRTVLFYIDVDYDSMRGSSFPDKVRESVDYSRRMGLVSNLLQSAVNHNGAVADELHNLSFITSSYEPLYVEGEDDSVDDIMVELEGVRDQKEVEREVVLKALAQPGSAGIKEALVFIVKHI